MRDVKTKRIGLDGLKRATHNMFFYSKYLVNPFFFFVALHLQGKLKAMKTKYYILGVLTILCLLGTGYYAWTLYDAYRKQVAEWKEGAKAAFGEALWLEVNKRSEIPFYSYSSEDGGMMTLNERIPDSVSVITADGLWRYKIDRYKYDNSLIKETLRRGDLGALLEMYPLSIDSLSVHWNNILFEKQLFVRNQLRYIYTDLKLQNDTVYSVADKRLSGFDSLTVKYLGFRCEHELVAFVSYPYWLLGLSMGDYCILLLPWILLTLLFVCYPNLESLAKQKMTHEKVIEKTVEVEKEVIVEKEIYVVDVQMNKDCIFHLPDGTVFDSLVGILMKDGLQQRLQPQSVSLLKLFLGKEDHLLTSDEICMKLWGDTGYADRLRSAISRLRNDLNAVKSESLVSCSYGVYELIFPISSKISVN